MMIQKSQRRAGVPVQASHEDRQLDLQEIFTDEPRTAAAVAAARSLSRGLGARITVLVTHVVPYPLPLTAPAVDVGSLVKAAQSVAASQPPDTSVAILLCRDRCQALRSAVRPESLVVVGSRRRWWPTWEQKLARMLKRDGRRVVMVTR